MMNLSRRSIVKGAALAACTATPMKLVFGQSAEFTYKFATSVPPAHPTNVRAKEAADAIRAETNGRVDIQIFPSGQLGSDTDVISQLRSVGVEFFSVGGANLSTLVPVAALPTLGFAFSNYTSLWRAMDGELGAFVRSQLAKANLIAMDKTWDNGFRQITTSTRSITRAEDLRGLKIRIPVAPIAMSMFKAFEAAPTSINIVELYTSLQTKIVEGQENPLSVVSLFKLNEVQKYCSITNHQWDGFWCVANRRAWERFPEALRTIVAKHLDAAAVAQRSDIYDLNTGLQKELSTKGMTFNTPATDGFREKLRNSNYYAEWQGKFGAEAWGIFERAVGKLS